MDKTRYREQILLRACIDAGQPFVVDNTNPSVEERARYVEPERSGVFQVIGGYYFRAQSKAALDRNVRRMSKAYIPEKGILSTHKRLRVPSLKEGFD